MSFIDYIFILLGSMHTGMAFLHHLCLGSSLLEHVKQFFKMHIPISSIYASWLSHILAKIWQVLSISF